MFRLLPIFIFAVATTSYGKNVKFPSSLVGGRIVGGEDTTIEDYPYQISLQVGDRFVCGGSLIRPNVVLTAAHCMEFTSKDYLVRAGSSIIKEGGQVAQVTDVCSHPKFNKELLDYDVSVLKLNKSLILNSAVQLLKLQEVGKKIPVNTMATVTGWGYLKFGVALPKILQKVQVPKVCRKKCQKIYWNLQNFTITKRMTCYGYVEGGKDFCQGDSGGPLVVNGKQVGIVSFFVAANETTGCGLPNIPSVYTSLKNEEIQQHIKKCIAKFS